MAAVRCVSARSRAVLRGRSFGAGRRNPKWGETFRRLPAIDGVTATIDSGGSTMSSTPHIGAAASVSALTLPAPASRRRLGSSCPRASSGGRAGQAAPGGRADQAAAAQMGLPSRALAGNPVGVAEHGATQLAADGGQGRAPSHRREPGPSTPRRGRSLRPKVGAVLAVLALVVSTVSPAGAHWQAVRVDGDCPNHSASVHHDGVNGTYTVQLSPRSWNDHRCLRSEILVRGFNINGEAEGWTTRSHRGDPGVLATWIAEDVRWTKHNVRIRKNGQEFWDGVRLWH